MPRSLAPLALLGLSVSLGACINTFDPALYARDGGGALDAGAPPFALADECGATIPELVLPAGTSDLTIGIDTRGLSHVGDRPSCLDRDAPGPDGFLRVQMGAGDRWHFHFRRTGTQDPALYVLRSSCDLRTCAPNEAADLCGTSADEHLTFEPTAAGSYVVAIDSFDTAGLQGALQIIHPACGNSVLEHSETCDDGNTEPLDGCDEQCRHELTPGNSAELEVNDDRFSANHVLPSGGTILVTGRVASVCESDWFAIDLTEGASLRAELLTAGGAACPATRPANLELELRGANGQTSLALGSETTGCAAIDPARDTGAAALPAGRYFVRVYARNDAIERPFDYGLRLTLE